MATTTPNFGWPVPTSTDLVKDGATAIEALGDSIDASLLDLKGGTTGQVLAKASGTDMDFSWVAQDDSNAIQNAIVDAKGDLIAASAADTPARLAVGTNGQTLIADSTAATGLKWAKAPNFTGAVVNSNAGQSISTATQTSVTFNLEQIDTDAFHSTSTNTSRFTIPSGLAGKYRVGGAARFPQNALGRRLAQIITNGGTAKTFEVATNASAFVTVSGSAIFELAVADYVEFQVYQDSGSSLSLVTNTDSVFFEIEYLGA